jgi:hypothetical protein
MVPRTIESWRTLCSSSFSVVSCDQRHWSSGVSLVLWWYVIAVILLESLFRGFAVRLVVVVVVSHPTHVPNEC